MANYNSIYTGSQIDEAVGKVRAAGDAVAGLGTDGKVLPGQSSAAYATITSSETVTAARAGKVLLCTANATLTLPAGLTDGTEVEIWNLGNHTVTLSGSLFVSGTGAASTATVEANSVCGVKLMNGVWYVSGSVS